MQTQNEVKKTKTGGVAVIETTFLSKEEANQRMAYLTELRKQIMQVAEKAHADLERCEKELSDIAKTLG